MNRYKKEKINSLFVGGGTLNINKTSIDNHNIRADALITRQEYIRNFTGFIHELLNNKTTVATELIFPTIAYREIYKSDRRLTRVLNTIKDLPFEQQNKTFIKKILPTIIAYLKVLKSRRQGDSYYKRKNLSNI